MNSSLACENPSLSCTYFDSKICQSCSLLPLSYSQQLAHKEERIHALLPFPSHVWEQSMPSAPSYFRNKAKLAVGGSVESPILGIMHRDFSFHELTECPLYTPAMYAAFPVIREFITRARLFPYNPATNRGELKFVLLTVSPSGQMLLRFVLRSHESLVRIRKHHVWLRERLPQICVLSANIQPHRSAILEGEEEIIIEGSALPFDIAGVRLYGRARSFFQTNTAIAERLYLTAAHWMINELHRQSESDDSPFPSIAGVATSPALRIWDLYCGVGGFALTIASQLKKSLLRKTSEALSRVSLDILGIEISEHAVLSAQKSAEELHLPARFVAGDAIALAREITHSSPTHTTYPNVLIVNPPRRGIGELAAWIEEISPQYVLYSSCNPESLAKDAHTLTSYECLRAQIFDMFPHTEHGEVLTLLRRKTQ